jgi:hypothetical protein
LTAGGRRPRLDRSVSGVRLALSNAGDLPRREVLIDAHLEGRGVALANVELANIVDVFACFDLTETDHPHGGKMQGLFRIDNSCSKFGESLRWSGPA